MPVTNEASSICPSAHHAALFLIHPGISVKSTLDCEGDDDCSFFAMVTSSITNPCCDESPPNITSGPVPKTQTAY